MARGGGGRGGGRGGGGGRGRRDARPGGGASRDDRDRRDYRPRRSPSPDRRPRRSRGEGGDRNASRGGRTGYGGGDRSPPRRGHTGYGGRSPPRRGNTGYGDRSPPRRGHTGYGDRSPPRRGHTGYGDSHVSPCRRREYDQLSDLPGRGPRDYGNQRRISPQGQRDYGGDRHGSSRSPPEHERAPYGEHRPSGSYNAPPAYMLPDHPSDLGRPSLRAGKKESDYFGGPSDRSDYFKGPSRRNIDKESEFLGDGAGPLKIVAAQLGRTSSLYKDRRSPPARAGLSPPLYPSMPPTDTGFLTGGSSMKAVDGFGAGSSRLLPDDVDYKYQRDLPDPYVERSREIERRYNRDVVLEKNGGTDRLYSSLDVPARTDRETERLYSTRGMIGSDLVPCTQPKLISDSSPSLLAKNQPYGMHSEPGYEPSNGYIMDAFDRPSHDSLGHVSGHAHRFPGSSLERGSGHGDEAILDVTRQAHSKHTPRAESAKYDARDEYIRSDPINHTYIESRNLRGNVSHNSRHTTESASLRGLKDERINHHLKLDHRMEEDDDSFQAMRPDMDCNVQHPYEGDASAEYAPARGVIDRYSHSPVSEPIRIVRRPARQHEFPSFDILSDQEISPMVSRKRYRSPAYHDHWMDLYQSDDEFTGREYQGDDVEAINLSPPRMPRSFDVVDDEDEYDARFLMPTSGNVFSRLALPHESDEEWVDADLENRTHSNIFTHGRSNYIPMSQRLSRPNSHSQFGGPSMHGRGRGGLSKSAKKRLRTAAHQSHGGYPSDRNESIKPNKFPDMSENNANGFEVKHEDAPEHEDLPLQKDPPEGSEEFRKQVEQAFLKYVKVLNESPSMQKKYQEASKGTLSCCVCGSIARKFPDLDALVSHAYNTCKVGLKTKHIGFHKALCVLMGWNWHVAPDTSKGHHSIPAEEVNAMKADLMLWPPVVVMHNSSIANKAKDTEAKILSIQEIEGVLTDIGVARDKAKVSHGRPANQSVFVVKFQPTVSGFQEAMRVHGHFFTRNHGKKEFQEMSGGKGKAAAAVDNPQELLYAYIAVVEDLGYLDEETKKRCIIRSKKDIEATADATLNLEP